MKFKKIHFVAFLIPCLILFFSFWLVVFDTDFYKSELEKYDVYDKFDKETADSAVENLISYMRAGIPLSDFFNEKEKLHMVDVKNIIQKVLVLFYMILSATIIILFFNRKYFFRYLFYGSIASLAIILLLFIFCYTGFDFIFYKFHEIFFSNDFWKLNPEVDNLKALMPDNFFYDALERILCISLIISCVLILAGFLGMKNFKYFKKFIRQ